jgi:hypothetical protein
MEFGPLMANQLQGTRSGSDDLPVGVGNLFGMTILPLRKAKCSAERNGIAVTPFLHPEAHLIPLFIIMNLEPEHNEAMRKEIGHRLGMFFSNKQASAPDRMLQLVDQLSRLDHDTVSADSLNPEASIERTDAWLRAIFVQQEHHLRERLQDELNRFNRDELERLLAKIDDTLRGELGSS